MNRWQRYRRLTFWNRLGAWGSVASILSIPLAIILCIVPFVYTVCFVDRAARPAQNMASTTPEEDVTVKKTAPTVTLLDGRQATVGFTVTTHIEEPDTTTVVVKCGTADKARDSLEGKVLSAVIAQMEKRTLAEARQTRTQIGKELLSALSPSFKDVGLTLDDISLTEIKELRSGPKL